MNRILPFAPLSILVGFAALAAILTACIPTSSGGSVQPTQTTGPDFDGIALATHAAGTATAVAGEQVQPTPVLADTPVDASIVGPIQATFFPDRQATEYVVEMGSPVDEGSWTEVFCGDWQVEPDGYKMTWGHAHPPCDETTGHDDQMITFFVRVPTHEGVRGVWCFYQGASSGTGEPCVWGGLQ